MTRANSPNPSAFMRQDHTPDARLCNHIAWSARWRDRKFSIEAATKALSRADAPDGLDPVEAGLALRTLAWQATWKGQFAAAEDYADRAILFLEESDSWAALVDAHVAKATIHLTRFRMDLAKEDLQIARQIVARDRRPDTLVNLLCTETILLRIYRADDEAYACLTEAMHHASGNEEARVLHQLARFYVYVDNHGEAIAKAKLAVVSGPALAQSRHSALHARIPRLSPGSLGPSGIRACLPRRSSRTRAVGQGHAGGVFRADPTW